MGDDTAALAKLSQQMLSMANDVADIKNQVATLNTSLERLARIEERHQNHHHALERAFTTLKEHDGRIKAIEVQEPISKMVQKWVITGVIGVVSLVGLQIVGIVIQQSRPTQVIIDPEVARPRPGP